MKKTIVKKDVRFATKEESEMIIKYIVLQLRKDTETVFKEDFSNDEEIDAYNEYKDCLTITRIDMFFNTDETITMFDVLHISDDVNSDYFKTHYNYILTVGGLTDISTDDFCMINK